MNEESLFVAALEMDDDSVRRAFLDGACAGDVELRRRVEQLLSAHEKTLGILDQSEIPAGSGADEDDDSEGTLREVRVGAVLADRYKLLEPIAAGGMGTVWKAEQTQPVRRVVALKLIQKGMGSKTVLSRFEAERQALALMDHPNIAKVLDGGTTESGRPFFVMEFVQGVPLTQYCDEARLSIAQRLALFVPICQAVQHAHTKGVIHRDLKPNNILVCLYDGEPVPKVIDFGLAKAIQEPLTEKTLHTAHGALLGTPLYMSPEQAELNNLDVDARADVYALGVILYELLTGTTPLERARFQAAAWHELLRLIKEEEPPRPSSRLSNSDSLPSLAAQRRLEPVRLTKLVRGELDWIVMKCLEKDRARRYDTADGLARDVQRYLTDESVEACPPSARYRLSKFVRRHRGPVWAASIIALLLVAGIFGTSWGIVRADRARRAEAARADGERNANARAQQRLRQIEKGAEVLASVFSDLDPRAEEKEDRPLRAILGDRLARAAEQLEGEGEGVGDPLVVAILQSRLGMSLSRLGMPDRAIPLYEKARDTRVASLGAEHVDTLEILNNLAMAYQASGDPYRSLPLFERARDSMSARRGPRHAETLTVMNNLAGCYLDAGKVNEAVSLYEETLELRQAELGADHRDTFDSMNNLALAYQAVGKPYQALPLLEETLNLRKAKLGEFHADTLTSMNSLAEGYRAAGKRDQALPLWEEALRLRKARLGPTHPDTLAVMNNLATGYRADRELDLALPLLEETYKLTKAKRGPDHPDTLKTLNNLAAGYQAADKLDLAVSLWEDVFRLYKVKHGPTHPDTLSAMHNLAWGYRLTQKMDLALPLSEENLRLRKATQRADHPNLLISMNNLAACYRDADRLDEAIPLWAEALSLTRASLGPDHPNTLLAINNLATGYESADKPDQAVPLLKEAAAGVERRGFSDDFAEQVLKNLISTQEHIKQFSDAEPWRRKWLPVVKKRSGARSSPYARELASLGANLLQQQKWIDAESVLREALAIREQKEPGGWKTRRTQSLLGAALLGQKKYADAESLLVQGYEGLKAHEAQIPPPDRERVIESGKKVVQLYEAWGQADKAAQWRARLGQPSEAKPKS
jgi:eukaryotic-like serine/threonine-protein kinase